MPVMGPSYSEEQADEALAEIMRLLQEKYKIFQSPPDAFWEESRKTVTDQLRKAVHECFRQECFEWF